MNSLTPIQQVNGLYLKRDDLYQPFGAGEVNGGKLRQCMMLTEGIHEKYEGLITCCSVHSPQAPITAAAAKAFGMKCEVLYGGTTAAKLQTLPMPRMAMKYGANISIASRCGRHAVLNYIAQTKEIVKDNIYYIIKYGINLLEHEDILLRAVSTQTKNLPDEMENLVLTCGSGITAIGVLIGLKMFHKKIKHVHLTATAPDRRGMIHDTLRKYGADREIVYHDLFHSRGFVYEKPAHAVWGGIKLHPNYEAKSMAWFSKSGLTPEETIFWITGAEPTHFAI